MVGIELSGVSKAYRSDDGSALPVLDELSMSIAEERFFTLVGPSGSGKTTLLHILAGLEDPDSGAVELQGEGRLGFVFQDPRLLEWRTVGENLAFALDGTSLPESEYDRRIDGAVEMVGLDGYRDAYPRTLSGGMQQRAALARAFCIDPDVLLMDEPFGSVDEITARELRNDLLDLWRDNRATVLFVTHDIREAIILSDAVGVLSRKPARIKATVEIESPRPRNLNDEATVQYHREILSALEGP